MLKKHYVLAIVSFLLIPVAILSGGMLFSLINPEIAAGHADYERNYRLLDQVKHSFIWATLLVNAGLWLLTCFFLLKSKKQSYAWLFLAVLGPFGFAGLSMLNDNAPAPADLHHQFVHKLNVYVRVAYEFCFFVVAWVLAVAGMVLRRDLMIWYESATTGVSTAQIIELQNASSGMYAFGEGLVVLYLVVLIYLLWPVCINLLGRLPGLWTPPQKA